MSPKKKEQFVNPKVIVREIIGNGLVAAFDDIGYFTNDTTHMILSNSLITLKWVLGLLNTKLMAWFFRKYFAEENDLFPKVKINELKILPIVLGNEKAKKAVINRVDKILAVKKSTPNGDTTALEEEIDQLVYGAYGLTEGEIRIIEGETA